MTDLCYLSATELSRLILKKELSPVELMEAALRRIEEVNPAVNAFVALRADEALAEARAMEEKIASGWNPGPLAGIPLGVKDLEDVEGMVTSFGSIPYRENMASADSLQVARLRAAGAIVVGKTNTPEFGFTGFTKNRLHGVTRNPWDLERTPGGSSGGSAAAVAAGMVPLATGSDAGGSIRIPACYSGCFGIKPTRGRIPLVPMQPFYMMSRLWTLGPLTRTVEDAALYLDCAAGYHSEDPDSLPQTGISYGGLLREKPVPFRIGFSPTLGYASVQRDILAMAESAAGVFEELGHRVEVWKGEIPDVRKAWSDLAGCDIYAQVGQDLEGMRPDLGRALVQALDHARGLSLDDHIANHKLRTELNRSLAEFFVRFDLLLTPAMPTEAFAAKGPPPSKIDGRPIPLLGAVAYTYPFNLSGHPAATVRVGLTEAGLPAGLQIVGPRHREDSVLQAARAYEQACPWNDRWPDM
jgi:aspartyl-tRNA(Asn)/glutamyl-tRNA(Gln) amidotransferase subunit A